MNSKNLKKGRISKKSLPFIAVSVASVGFALSNPVKAADVDVKEDVVATEASEVTVTEVKENVAAKEVIEPEVKEKAVAAEVKDENTSVNSEVVPEEVKSDKVEVPASNDLQLMSEATFAAATQENEPVALSEDTEPVQGDEFNIGDLKYRVVDINALNKAVKLSGYNEGKKPTGIFIIPNEITHETVPYPVEGIGSNALKDCSEITKVELPESIKSIGDAAFINCSKLATINLPAAIKDLGESVFHSCSALTKAEIPEGITDIKAGTFNDCSALKEIQIPANVKTIGTDAFKGCTAITKIKIPASVTSIGDGAFNGCSVLKYMMIEGKSVALGGNTVLSGTSLGNGDPGTALYVHKELKEDADFKTKLALTKEEVLKEIPTKAPSIQNVKQEIKDNKLTISWDAAENASGYKITRKVGEEKEEVLEEELTATEYVISLPEDKSKLYTYSVIPYVLYNSSAEQEDEYGNMPLEGAAKEIYYGEIEIKAPTFEGGSITFDKNKASVGEKVTMMVKPNSGYILVPESLKINDGSVEIEKNENGTYTFAMPGEALKIEAEFKSECPEIKYTDLKTGVMLEAPEGTFPDGSHVVVEEVEKDHANYALVWNDVDDYIKEVGERFKFYSIEVLDKDGNKVQPKNGNKVKICLPVPEGYDIKDLEAFKIESGDDTHYESKIELIDGKNYLVFEVDHFCYYGIIDPDMNKVEKLASKNEQNNSDSSKDSSNSENSDKSEKTSSKGSSSKSKGSESSGFYKTSDGRLSSILACIFSSISSGAAYLFSRKSRKRK